MSQEFLGKTFGQYEILEFINDNGVIQTYRALQKSLTRPVAVQVINPQHRTDSEWSKAFAKGAEIAAKYPHPNIVPVIDSGEFEGVSYVVLRYMEGGTLAKRMEQGALPIQDTVSIIRQIATALDYVHSQGSCHGDPATVNIIFDAWGNAFIADFYLIGYLQSTSLELPVGVPAFMAPERMQAKPPTALSDQHSLAGVAYYMLTGKFPWNAPARARLPETIPFPQTYRSEIPTAMNDVLIRALAKNPEDRYPTIMEFARQFEKAAQAAPKHLFISYSRRDKDYAQQLRHYLDQNGLPVWIDDEIEHGDQWFNMINEAIQGCAAFLIVMTPDAEKSEWVQKEILLAKRYKKPIYPLLRHGMEFPLLIDIQFADVRNGELPDVDFYRRVARAVYGE